MDRFIAMTEQEYKIIAMYLKSNMDRFIVTLKNSRTMLNMI